MIPVYSYDPYFTGYNVAHLIPGCPVYLVLRPLVQMQGGSVVPKGSRVLASSVQHLVESSNSLLEGGHKLTLCLTLR